MFLNTFPTKFKVDYARDLCKCENCHAAIPKYGIRFVKQAAHNPYLTCFYHVNCLFNQFKSAKLTIGLIESIKDIENYQNIDQIDQIYITQLIKREFVFQIKKNSIHINVLFMQQF